MEFKNEFKKIRVETDVMYLCERFFTLLKPEDTKLFDYNILEYARTSLEKFKIYKLKESIFDLNDMLSNKKNKNEMSFKEMMIEYVLKNDDFDEDESLDEVNF